MTVGQIFTKIVTDFH